jgi:hypothetical protein
MKKTLSRQRIWQLEKIAMGLCGTCGTRPLVTGDECAMCMRPWTKKKKGETATTNGTVLQNKAVVRLLRREIARLKLDLAKLRYVLAVLASIEEARDRPVRTHRGHRSFK